MLKSTQAFFNFGEQAQGPFAIFGDGGGALVDIGILGCRFFKQGLVWGQAAKGGFEHTIGVGVRVFVFRHGNLQSGLAQLLTASVR
jgi:hypothetical protein